jgi:hypothetical protein
LRRWFGLARGGNPAPVGHRRDGSEVGVTPRPPMASRGHPLALRTCTPSGRRRRGPPRTVAPWIASQRGPRPPPLSR